ncbi:MAG: TAXI family TRAP transporter solute-binding subunit [Cyanobacteria bacterium J06648_16]
MAKGGRVVLLGIVTISIMVGIASLAAILVERNRIYTVRLATGGPTGEYYKFGQAIAQVTEAHEPKIRIEVVESAGSTRNMQDVQNRVADLALVQNDTKVLPDVRAIAQLYPEMFHFIARKDAGFESVADLKGKRIALMPAGSGSYTLFWPLIQHYGLAAQDFRATAMTPREAHVAIASNEVDAMFRIIGLGNQSVANLLRTDQFELIPIDQVGALQLAQPYLQETTITRGTYDGGSPIPPDDLPVVAVSSLLVAHKDVDPEVVRAITRVLYEYRNELIGVNPRTAAIESPEVSQNLGFPLHEGASAYYNQDDPNFFVEYAEPMGLLLSFSILVASGVWQFRLWLVGRQKNRADMYNLEILELIEQVDKAQSIQELQDLRHQLFSILKQVVVDLDIDRISPESFQSFTFPWEVAITTIRHQELVLLNIESTKN